MKIRRPEATDAADLARVHAAAWRSAYRDIVPDEVLDAIPATPNDEGVAAWRERVENDHDRFLVATDDGELVGYAVVRLEETKPFVGDDEAGLKELYVHPDRWGEGVGTALLEAALGSLPGSVTALRLEALRDNDLAREFYEARGFERTGTGTVDIAGSTYPTVVYSRSIE